MSVSEATELVPGRVYGLGGELDVAGRVSWVDPGAVGQQWVGCHVIMGEGEALLVDCGPVLLREQIIKQLKDLLPDGQELSIFLTRAEFDTSGNVGAVAAAVPVKAIYVAGKTQRNNPFDGFELAAAPARGARPVGEIEVIRAAPGAGIPLGGGQEAIVLNAPFRMLSANWLFDTGSATMFASDSFGYTVDRVDIEPDEALRNLVARYWWLPGSRTDNMRADVEAVFEQYPAHVVLSTHGCPFIGVDEVTRQREKFQTMLRLASTLPVAS